MRKFLVFNDEIANIMNDEDLRENWKEKLGLNVKYQATHKNPIITIFEVIDEKKAVKYYSHSKVRMMNKEEVMKYIDELNKDYPEYTLKDSTELLTDLLLSGKIKLFDLLSGKVKVEGYKPDKPLNDQENLKVLHDCAMGGIVKRKKPKID